MKETLKILLVMLMPWLCVALVLLASYYGEQIDHFFESVLKKLML